MSTCLLATEAAGCRRVLGPGSQPRTRTCMHTLGPITDPIASSSPNTAATVTEGPESITPPVSDASLTPELETHRRIASNRLPLPLEPMLGLGQGECMYMCQNVLARLDGPSVAAARLAASRLAEPRLMPKPVG